MQAQVTPTIPGAQDTVARAGSMGGSTTCMALVGSEKNRLLSAHTKVLGIGS